MKRFEHQVLFYDLSVKRQYEVMQADLTKWGEAGFEMVSVTIADNITSNIVVFLKREITDHADATESAA